MAVGKSGDGSRQGVEGMINEPMKIGAAGLDEEESRVLAYVRNERPDLERPFLANVYQGRREILHRLLQALMRENVAGILSQASWRSGVEKGLEIRLSGSRTLSVPVQRTLSFGRFDLCGSVTLRDGSCSETIEHPARLLDLLSDLPGYEGVVRNLAGEVQLARFRLEVRNSAANYALALAGAGLRRRELAARARESGVRTSPEWARGRTAGDGMFSPLAFYEQLVVDGHRSTRARSSSWASAWGTSSGTPRSWARTRRWRSWRSRKDATGTFPWTAEACPVSCTRSTRASASKSRTRYGRRG